MSSKHYKHLEAIIIEFFKNKGVSIILEPHGSRGADIESLCRTVIGEIKHADELDRDLKSSYWSLWNSSQSFGGKSSKYRIASDFSRNVSKLDDEVRGWLAVVYGQLNYYRQRESLSKGWIVFEKYNKYNNSLNKALDFLMRESKIISFSGVGFKGLGFFSIKFVN